MVIFYICRKMSLILQRLCAVHVFFFNTLLKWASLVAQMVKCLPAMRETWVQSLGWEDPLEREMETHSSTLAWKIPWTEEPGTLQSMGLQIVRDNLVSEQEQHSILSFPFILWGFPGSSDGKVSACNAEYPDSIPVSGRSLGEENGNPLQYSCLEKPMDREPDRL